MSDIQGDYRKIANKFGHYSDHRGMLAGMVIELAERIEQLEAVVEAAKGIKGIRVTGNMGGEIIGWDSLQKTLAALKETD